MTSVKIGHLVSINYGTNIYLGFIYSDNKDGTDSVYFPEDNTTTEFMCKLLHKVLPIS